MQHLNLYRFYELATKLHSLFDVETQSRVADMFAPLTEAQSALDSLIKGDPIVIESSKADAVRLLSKIGDLFDKYFIDQSSKQLKALESEDRVNQHELAMIHSLVGKFEHALAAELNRAPSYIAEKRGIYSTSDLIENAYQVFPPSLQTTIAASAQNEFNTAGRAIAFGLGTAAAVHLLRAIEIVLRQYYEMFSGGATAKGERNYAIYLKKLALLADDESLSTRPDRRVLQMLAQIKDHYRNPLTTPETNITLEQATSLFGLASAIISMMAEQIQSNKPQNTGNKRGSKSSAAASMEKNMEDDEDESYDFRMARSA
ncbi:MAG: hypothetical protein PHX43_06390 [Alphaproteobacteria bacterium]|nr:hypothetical protein [Alphaproteobacteria bacterium]